MSGIRKFKQQNGFTIVEVMIALVVLSVLLLVCTVVLVNLGQMYSKGSNMATAQNVARNVINDISNNLQLGGGGLTGSTTNPNGHICIGTTRFSYVVGHEVGVDVDSQRHPEPFKHGLWRDKVNSSSDCSSGITLNDMKNKPRPTPDGTELIPDNMRLTQFKVQPISNSNGLYSIEVGVAYGDNDLLCVRGASLNGGSDCDTSKINDRPTDHAHNLQNPGNRVIGCVDGAGQEYCGVSNLSTVVARRLTTE